MAADFNATLKTLRVTRLFLKQQSSRGLSGTEVAKELKFSRFTAYKILQSLERADMLKSSLEQFGSPPQRLYQMTPSGIDAFLQTLRSLQLSTAA